MDSENWKTSSYSGDHRMCVEAAVCRCEVKVRDTKGREQGLIKVSSTAWMAFLAGL